MSGLLEGRTGLVVGVANKRSIAWAIARKLDAAGARLALTYQGERTEGEVRKLAGTLAHPGPVLPLDVQDEAQLDAAVDGAAAELGGLDIVVHGVAYARPEELSRRFVETEREGFRTALEISAYSLTALAQRRAGRGQQGGDRDDDEHQALHAPSVAAGRRGRKDTGW